MSKASAPRPMTRRKTPGRLYIAVKAGIKNPTIKKAGRTSGGRLADGNFQRMINISKAGYPEKDQGDWEKHCLNKPKEKVVVVHEKLCDNHVLVERVWHALLGILPKAFFVYDEEGRIVKVKGPRKDSYPELTKASIQKMKKMLDTADAFVNGGERLSADLHKKFDQVYCNSCGKEAMEGYSKCASCADTTNQASARKREEKGKAGVCLLCKEQRKKGHTYCEKHLAAETGRKRKEAAALLAQGLCIQCRKHKHAENRKRCEFCLQKAAAAAAAKRAEAREKGLCSHCKKEKAVKNRILCQACSDKNSQGTKQREEQRQQRGMCLKCENPRVEGKSLCESCGEKARKNASNVLRRRLRTGKCTSCGQNPPTNGLQICEDCRKKNSKRNRQTAAQKREEGICLHCQMPALEGKSFCEAHAKRARDYTRAFRADRKKKGLCPECGNAKQQPEKSLCDQCLKAKADRQRTEEQRGKQRALRASRKKANTCLDCGAEKEQPQKSLCDLCLKKNRDRRRAQKEAERIGMV